MSTEAIVALIAAAGTIGSALIAWLVARSTAAKEIEKMKMQWARDDIVSSEEEFTEMVSTVSAYLHSFAPNTKAVSAVASLRSKENGDLAVLLDKLYADLAAGNTPHAKTDADLSKVIEEKRKRTRPKM